MSTRKSNLFVKIGAVLYNIGWKHRPRYNGKFAAGVIDYFDQTIDTYLGLAPTVEWINLWHEYLHGILQNAGYENHDERLINTLAHGICQILADNSFVHTPIDPMNRAEPEDEPSITPIEDEFKDDARTDSNRLDN